MANEIYKANDVQVRQQIKAHLDEADGGIAALGTRVTQNETDITALEAADVVHDARLDDLEGYRPAMMQYDGTAATYINTSITTSGDVFTFVCRFRIADFTGATSIKQIVQLMGPTPYSRVAISVFSSDYTAADQRGKADFLVSSSTGTPLCYIFSNSSLLDDEEHTLFCSFNGTTGTAVFIIDGVAQDDVAVASRVAPTTGTLDSGASSRVLFGNAGALVRYWPGFIGFAGYRDAGGLDWTDFMEADGTPKELDEISWTEWGAQPLLWNPHGEMTNNLGTAADLTTTGVIQLSLPGFGYAAKPIATQVLDEDDLSSDSDKHVPTQQSVKAYVDSLRSSGTFTPVIMDDSLSTSEGQTYTAQSGSYRKNGDVVTFWLDITVNSLGTLTTTQQAKIGGLPFAAVTTGGVYTAVHCVFASSLAITAGQSITGGINPGHDYIQMWLWDTAAGTTQLLISEYSAGGRVILSGSYIAA